MTRTIFASIPTRTALRAMKARTATSCPMLNERSGDICTTDREKAIEDGLTVTRRLRAPDDITIVHVQMTEILFNQLVASGDLQVNEDSGVVNITAIGCAALNRVAVFTMEVHSVDRGQRAGNDE